MSSVDERFTEYRKLQTDIERQAEEMRRLIAMNFGGGGNDGSGSGVDARLTRLENQTDKIGENLGSAATDIATIKENLRHLPSKGFIVSASIGAMTFLTTVLVFLDKLQNLFGLNG